MTRLAPVTTYGDVLLDYSFFEFRQFVIMALSTIYQPISYLVIVNARSVMRIAYMEEEG